MPLVPLLTAAVLSTVTPSERPPNIVFVLADDLGYAELGSYGQTQIRTPHLDQLAADGMRFTQHYSGSPVCAPSRCVLMTGYHTGHSDIRGNSEVGGWGPDEKEGQYPIPDETITVAELLRDAGYATGVFGKWGLGGPGSSGHPCSQGFDRFYGLLCQRVAHNFYPTHLWDDHDVDVLDGNHWFSAHQRIETPPQDEAGWAQYATEVYAPDRMIEEALEFVEANAERPFFLYYPTPVPHVALQVPADSLAEYEGAFDETPYLGQKGYLPHPTPRAAYAAMVTRMDRDIGSLLEALDRLGLRKNTLVMFSSDNGPTFNGGTDSEFFASNAPFRGLKCSVNEGGIRVPLIARWPARIAAGSVSDHLSAFQDFLPTACEVAGVEAPDGIDGISYLPALEGREGPQHDYLYFEYPERDGQQALRTKRWKVVRNHLKRGEPTFALYDLEADPGESEDVSAQHPEIANELRAVLRSARVPSERFPIPVLDAESAASAGGSR